MTAFDHKAMGLKVAVSVRAGGKTNPYRPRQNFATSTLFFVYGEAGAVGKRTHMDRDRTLLRELFFKALADVYVPCFGVQVMTAFDHKAMGLEGLPHS